MQRMFLKPTSTSILAADNAVVQLGDAMKRVESFNQKYGPKAFDEFVGPVDAPIFRAVGKYKGLPEADKKEARLIQQQIAKVVQDYRKDVFGATLTKNEQENMDQVVGTTGGNDYLVLTQGFAENLQRGLNNQVKTFRLYPDLPPDIKRRYAPEIFVRETSVQPPAQPAATNRVGRFTIEIEGQ